MFYSYLGFMMDQVRACDSPHLQDIRRVDCLVRIEAAPRGGGSEVGWESSGSHDRHGRLERKSADRSCQFLAPMIIR